MIARSGNAIALNAGGAHEAGWRRVLEGEFGGILEGFLVFWWDFGR